MHLDKDLFNEEFIEKLKQRDSRFKDVDLRLRVEQELRDSTSLKILLEAIGEQAAEALEALAEVDPTDTSLITRLQAAVQRSRFTQKTLNAVIRRGIVAEQSLSEETQAIQPVEEN